MKTEKQQRKSNELTIRLEMGSHRLAARMRPRPGVLKDRPSLNLLLHIAADALTSKLGDLLGFPNHQEMAIQEWVEARRKMGADEETIMREVEDLRRMLTTEEAG